MTTVLKELKSMNIGNAFRLMANRAYQNTIVYRDRFYSLTDGLLGTNRQSTSELVEYAFINNDNGYSVVTKIARLVGRTPRVLKMKATQNGREKKVVESGELHDLLLIAPNDSQTADEYMEELAINLLTTGEANVYKAIESIGFASKQLIPVPTEIVEPVLKNQSDIFEKVEKYRLNTGAYQKTVLADEMIISKFIDPSLKGKQTRRGLSPFQPLFTTMTANNNRNVAEASIFQNRGIAGFTSPKAMTGGGATGMAFSLLTDDKEKLDKASQERKGGAHKAGTVVHLDTPTDYTPFGMSPSDLKLLEAEVMHLRKICNALGVQSQIFNDPANKSYNNMKEAMKALYVDAVIAINELLISAHERTVIKEYEQQDNKIYYWEVEKDKIEALLPDPMEVKKQTVLEFENGLITEDEAREALGYNPLTDEQRAQIMERNRLRQPINNQNNGQGNNQGN